MFKIEINIATVLSLLSIIIGVALYIGWGVTYNVWADLGIYSITIFFVLCGVIGLLLSLHENKEE